MITAFVLAFALHVGDSFYLHRWHVVDEDHASKVAYVEQTKDTIVLRIMDIEEERLDSRNRFSKFTEKEFQMIGTQEYYNSDEELTSRTEYDKHGVNIRYERLYPNGQVSFRKDNQDKEHFTITQYYENGQMKRQEQVRMVDGERFSTGKCYAEDGSEIDYVPYETTVRFPGGMDGLKKWLKANIKYPMSYTAKGAKGTTMVQMTVDEEGVASNFRVVKSAGYKDMDQEAMRLVNMLPTLTPATKEGEAIESKFALPIAFIPL